MTSAATTHFDIEAGRIEVSPLVAPWSVGLTTGARNPFVPTSVADTLANVVAHARRTFGADGAGIVLTADGGAVPAAASGQQARRADALQADHQQGPAFQAIKGRQPVVSSELRFDSRWRFWAPLAADLGIRSVLSLALADGEPFGAISLYSRRTSFFRAVSLAPGLKFAQQASMAITAAVEREQLLKAADTRGVVGQAQGILMERYHLTADQALAVIRRSSSALNQKLRLIAERIIGGCGLPDSELLTLPYLVGANSIGSGSQK